MSPLLSQMAPFNEKINYKAFFAKLHSRIEIDV